MVLHSKGRFGPFWGCSQYRFTKCGGTRKVTKAPVVIDHTAIAAIQQAIGSDEQTAIWTAFAALRSGILKINALAGTGKSYTAKVMLHRLPAALRVLYCAFGTQQVLDFKATAPANCTVATLNSIGLSIVVAHFKRLGLRVTFDKDKLNNIIKALVPEKSEEETFIAAVRKLAELSQSYLINGNNPDELVELAIRHEVQLTTDIQDQVIALIPTVLKMDREDPTTVSYNDQLWLPIMLNMEFPQYNVVIIDEAQDLNGLQHQMALRLLAAGGKMAVIGDDNQAIYGWRGSDVDSMANLCSLLAGEGYPVREYPLTISRRCSKAVIAFAQQFVPGIKAMDNAVEGAVTKTTIDQLTYQPGDMILCRVNAPLAHIAHNIIKQGMRAIIKGRDIGICMIYIITGLRSSSVDDLLAKLEAWVDEQVEKYAGSRWAAANRERVEDQADCIRAMAEGCVTVAQVIDRIHTVFTDAECSADTIRLSSIHRAKGLEADRVVWAYPEIKGRSEQPAAVKQEHNLHYVASTRAKRELVLAHKPAEAVAAAA
jgi:superfamily I DNA/RNA helicase